MLDYLHLLPFFAWVPLALLAIWRMRERRGANVFWSLCGLFLLLWAANLYLEFVWSKTVVAPIRVDLLLTIPVAAGIAIIVGLWAVRQRAALPRIASILLLACSVPPLAVFVGGLWSAQRDAARLDTRPSLITGQWAPVGVWPGPTQHQVVEWPPSSST